MPKEPEGTERDDSSDAKIEDLAPRDDDKVKGGRESATGQATGKRHHGYIEPTKEWTPPATQ